MRNISKLLPAALLLIMAFFLTSCTKNVPPELVDKNKKTPITTGEMPNDSIHRNIQPKGQNQNQTNTDDGKGDEKADKYMKDADDADSKYEKSKSEADKKDAIVKQLGAANYLMFEANLSPKKKYKPALKRYRRVLELDPSNKEAKDNKQQIEDIYQSMGMPIPD
jgi:tetratricopeptide (TPR) repeat protein